MFSNNRRNAETPSQLASVVGAELLEQNPEMRRLVYPRRYQVPFGYVSPKKIARRMANILTFVSQDQDAFVDKTSAWSLEIVNKIVEYQVPTYWVGRELVEALMRTNFPDIHASELRWPMPAMIFMLPQNVFHSPGGFPVEFLGIGLCDNQRLICWTQIDEGHGPANYAISEHLDQRLLSEIREERIRDDMEMIVYDEDDPEAEQSFVISLLVLGINLIMVMNSRPQLIESGQIARPLGFGPRRERDQEASWTPNWIGQHYRFRREITTQSTGDSQSNTDGGVTLRPHWRKGHHRRQRWGEDLQQIKEIWIEPVFVNAARFCSN